MSPIIYISLFGYVIFCANIKEEQKRTDETLKYELGDIGLKRCYFNYLYRCIYAICHHLLQDAYVQVDSYVQVDDTNQRTCLRRKKCEQKFEHLVKERVLRSIRLLMIYLMSLYL